MTKRGLSWLMVVVTVIGVTSACAPAWEAPVRETILLSDSAMQDIQGSDAGSNPDWCVPISDCYNTNQPCPGVPPGAKVRDNCGQDIVYYNLSQCSDTPYNDTQCYGATSNWNSECTRTHNCIVFHNKHGKLECLRKGDPIDKRMNYNSTAGCNGEFKVP